MQFLRDVSPTFNEMAKETLQAAGNWWFDQIRTDGIIKFGDPDYADMEVKANVLGAMFGGTQAPKTVPSEARQVFVDTLIKTCLKRSEEYYFLPRVPTGDLCYPMATDYGIPETSIFAPALAAIGIDRNSNPLPMKTSTTVRLGLVTTGWPHDRVIYLGDKHKWLKIWKEIDTKVVAWDGAKIVLDTKLAKAIHYSGTKLASAEELYQYLKSDGS